MSNRNWISVENELPTRETMKVIVYFRKWYNPNFLSIATYSRSIGWECRESDCYFRNGSITHWMPLPEPPDVVEIQ